MATWTPLPQGVAANASSVILQDPAGNVATNTVFGSQAVTIDPITVFNDTFDGATLDVTNHWTAAGTVPPTLSGTGNLLVNPGTAASASSSLISQPTFIPFGVQLGISYLAFETPTIALGNHRFFGLGTQPGSWTALTPLQDALGFEVDTAGFLRASIYSGGTRFLTQVLAIPKDGFSHLYYFITRPLASYFYQDGVLVATLLGVAPQVATLPLRYHSINGTSTTTGTPTIAGYATALIDFARPSQGLSDGLFPWRRQKVGANGEVYVNNAVATYPSTPTNVAYSATTDTAFSAANASRRQYIVSNDTTAKLYILLDQSGAGAASATNFTYAIPAGGTFEMPNPLSTARVRGFWAAGGAGSAGVTDISGGTVQGSA